ncbi:hypothetical protein KM043_016167 [Ampulex compressa]|nr:hypothetical protein KM043_016167 [Ampulex compressa]
MREKKWFDYEVDSDDEWEEEEPGESLHGSEDERDEENPEDNEYDVDNEFMVPHGYLSDEEALADEEEKEDMTPETQKFKLKILGEQFEAERNAKTSKLKPKIIGCIWQGAENTFPENTPSKTVEFLLARQAWVRQIPITLPSVSESENATSAECTTPTHQQVNGSTRKKRVPNEALPDLLRLIHGNVHGRNFLAKEFMAYWASKGEHQISKASLLQKIRELAKWTACPEERFKNKSCWYVSADTRRQYLPENEELTLPNCWTYTLEPKRKSDVLDISERSEKEEKDKEKKSVPLITQFTKKITQEEMKKQLSVKPTNVTPSKPPLPKTPKRATLISVPRGEQFPKSSRDSLFPKITIKEKVPNKYVNSKTNAQDTDKVTIVEHAEAVKASKSEGNPGINDKKSESDRNMKKKVGKKAKKNLQKVLPGISISTNADAKNNKDARNVDKADIIEVSDHDE